MLRGRNMNADNEVHEKDLRKRKSCVRIWVFSHITGTKLEIIINYSKLLTAGQIPIISKCMCANKRILYM